MKRQHALLAGEGSTVAYVIWQLSGPISFFPPASENELKSICVLYVMQATTWVSEQMVRSF